MLKINAFPYREWKACNNLFMEETVMNNTLTSVLLASALMLGTSMSLLAQEVQPGRVAYNSTTKTISIDNVTSTPSGFQGYCIWGSYTGGNGVTNFQLYDPGLSTSTTNKLTLPRTRANKEPNNINMFWVSFNDNNQLDNWFLRSGMAAMNSAMRRHAQVLLYCTNHNGIWYVNPVTGFSGWSLDLAIADNFKLEVTPYSY
jgi:hypothetical protein